MGVELFVTPAGLIVNEIAPRVHNSGHWTQNGCAVDQFEQHIRAVAGWSLGDGQRHSDVVMENLIGADMDRVPELSQERDVALHLYGKAEVKAAERWGTSTEFHGDQVTNRAAISTGHIADPPAASVAATRCVSEFRDHQIRAQAGCQRATILQPKNTGRAG